MSAPVSIGETLAGKYTVERVLGVGGMGVVVAAKHIHLGERVAIKFLLPHALVRPDVVERFLREGKAAAKMKSEHIARVRDTGTLDSGAPYLVMEYLDGQDLSALLRAEGTLPMEVAVDYVLQACEALADAHAAGVIHRDLKPGNLFLARRNDGSPVIKVIDFGISKLGATGEAPEGGAGEMTQTAMMMGSPFYMAPEQMASARDVDARSDIWSLGIILHTLLTGTPPFKAPSVMEIFELILAGAPPLRRALPSAPEGLEAILLKCLQRDRAQRFDNVAELAAALVPFGPAGARESADRSARILRVNSGKGSTPPPPLAAPRLAGSDTPAAIVDGKKLDAPASASASIPEAPSAGKSASASASASIPGDPNASQGPWDRSQEPTQRRSSRSLLAVGSVLAIVAVAGIFAFTRGNAPPAAPLSPTAEPAITTAPPAATSPRDALVPSVAPALAAPTATAIATASAAPPLVATPIVTARPATPAPRPRPPASPPADPFGGSQK
jgi:eukaryotic-like serine/threonine-protein kinase